MRNILFDSSERPKRSTLQPDAPTSANTPRRLLSISMALQLSGTPPPNAEGQILLARYVAGQISLADLMPLLS